VRPEIIKHGKLTNSWYLAAVAALNEYPERLAKVFGGATTYPHNGQFVMNFWLYGEPQRVTIDDRLPGALHKNHFDLVNV
jgi:hypothetical protein